MNLDNAITKWTFFNNAFNGTGGFENGGYIDRYSRESEDKYQTRKKSAIYENMFRSNLNRYIGYIFKNTPTRTTKNQIVKNILDDVDNKGNSIDVFISNFATNAKIKGCNLLLIDLPTETATNLKEQIDKRLLPYFVEIPPENLLKYRLDENGKFDFVMFSDTIDNSTFTKKDIVEIKRYYDKNEWSILDKNDNVIATGVHNLGVNPVLIFSETGSFPDVGEFSQIAYLQKKLYNKQSEFDEILRGQTFSILTIQADNPSDIEIKLATDNAIGYGKGVNKPEFIATPSAPAEIYQNEIERLKNAINEIAYNLSTNQSVESGIALSLKFQGLNSSLSKFAIKLNDLENRAFDIVCRYLKIQNDVVVTYPKTFDIIDINKEIETLSEMKNLINSPTYFKLKTLQIISNDLNTIDIEDFAKISAEIEDELK